MLHTLAAPVTPEKITGFQRIALHENFVLTPDLNMIQQVRVVILDGDGQPLVNRILNDPTLTAQQRKDALERYGDKIIDKTTQGAFIDPKTKAIVEAGTEGAIPQRDYFQQITIGQIKAMGLVVTDDTPFSTLLYAMIANEISNIDKRGDL